MRASSAAEGQLLRLLATGTQGKALPRNYLLLRQGQSECLCDVLTVHG